MKTKNKIISLLHSGEKADLECKEAARQVPKSIYETYSAFANTNGGIILLGIRENKDAINTSARFTITGVADAGKIISDFWNTINGSKVNVNLLFDENVYSLEINGSEIVVIEVPRADYTRRPVYIGENPFKGSFKRNHEGDYHCTDEEVRAMIRDQNSSGNDGLLLEYYTMDDIDKDTLARYRNRYRVVQPDNAWNDYDDKEFLRMLGGYREDRQKHAEGLTMAGLLMFGKGYPVRDVFDNILMDYREETDVNMDLRWNDRITYDGTWENNLYNFFEKVVLKLTEDLPRPFHLEGMQRQDDTPVHKAIREAMINMIIHADFQMQGTLKVIKKKDEFLFTNPGVLKIPRELIYQGGNSKSRNPRIQTMFRMVGFGDSAGSGFPAILSTWEKHGWPTPDLEENTILDQVTLRLKMTSAQHVAETDSNRFSSNYEDYAEQSAKPKRSSKAQSCALENDGLEQALLRIIKEQPSITQTEMARETNVSRRTVQNVIERLKEEEKITRIGGKRYGHWKIIEK